MFIPFNRQLVSIRFDSYIKMTIIYNKKKNKNIQNKISFIPSCRIQFAKILHMKDCEKKRIHNINLNHSNHSHDLST